MVHRPQTTVHSQIGVLWSVDCGLWTESIQRQMTVMERILVVLPNWFGETLFTTPFLRALRSQAPQAWIATLGWPQCREVLLHNPHVSERLEYDERGTHRSLSGKRRLIHLLRERRFDTAFILRKSLSRSLLLVLAGVSARIGWANVKSGWLLTRRVHMPCPPLHKATTYLPLLEAVGCSKPDGVRYDYFVSEEERRQARELLRNVGAADGHPLAILHPGANWFHKRWAPERFAALGDRLAGDRLQIVITGGPDDCALAESIVQRMHQPAAVLAGHTSFRQLGACLEQAQLVVSNDTGVAHIAAALARPLVALYGPTSPALTGPLSDPGRTTVLHHPGCCPSIPCYSPDRPPHAGMDSITVDEAYEAAKKLLEAGGSRLEAG